MSFRPNEIGNFVGGEMMGIVGKLAAAAVLSICAARTTFAQDQAAAIRQVQLMPDIPSPCIIRDWKQVAISQDKLLFDPDAKGQYMPLFHLVRDDQHRIVTFGLPDYVGDLRQTDGRGAGITDIGAIWGATLVGIDK